MSLAPLTASGSEAELRRRCRGTMPLEGRLEPWQTDLCSRPDQLASLIERHGSPINVIDPRPLGQNHAELDAAAESRGVDLDVFFARKANKALSLADEAHRLGLGVDLASENELRQVLDRGVPGPRLIMSAAIKPAGLLRLCVDNEVPIVVDNEDELAETLEAARSTGREAILVPRLAVALPGRAPTRFGMDAEAVMALAARCRADALGRVAGLHFHLDGYEAGERAQALAVALGLVDELRPAGHAPAFIDIGGGIPMSYLDRREQWDAFWAEHRGADSADERRRLTFDGHELGKVYPYWQQPARGEWLGRLLDTLLDGATIADQLRSRGLTLRCEPGRSLLDGCGLTAARVEYRKERGDGERLFGLAMNRTQCRSTSDDFLVDPLLIRPQGVSEASGPCDGFLVGAYCIERELLSWRRFEFPEGVAVGDIVVFPNTAGYLMHILESASHQIPLARNLVLGEDGGVEVDAIDAPLR